MKVHELQGEIMRLKKEKDVCILAHAYQSEPILEIADHPCFSRFCPIVLIQPARICCQSLLRLLYIAIIHSCNWSLKRPGQIDRLVFAHRNVDHVGKGSVGKRILFSRWH